jgi:ribosomal protein S21
MANFSVRWVDDSFERALRRFSQKTRKSGILREIKKSAFTQKSLDRNRRRRKKSGATGADDERREVGEEWLTLFPPNADHPPMPRYSWAVDTAEADRLQKAFIEAGATGTEPCDTLMCTSPFVYAPWKTHLAYGSLGRIERS